jgi:hypothetical protein
MTDEASLISLLGAANKLPLMMQIPMDSANSQKMIGGFCNPRIHQLLAEYAGGAGDKTRDGCGLDVNVFWSDMYPFWSTS